MPKLYGVLPEGMKQSSFFFLHSTLCIQPIFCAILNFRSSKICFNLENFRFLARWWFGGFSLSEWFHIMLLCFRYHLSSIFYWSMLYFLCHVTSAGSLIWPKWPPIWTFELSLLRSVSVSVDFFSFSVNFFRHQFFHFLIWTIIETCSIILGDLEVAPK